MDSSSEEFFEPVEINKSTLDILQHGQQLHTTANEQPNTAYNLPLSTTQTAEGISDPIQNDEQSKPPSYASVIHNENHSLNPSQSNHIKSNHKKNTSLSYPTELTKAFEQMNKDSTHKNPHLTIKDKDTQLTYDIDNLPIHISHNPHSQLSLAQIQKSAEKRKLQNGNNDNDAENGHKTNKKDRKSKFGAFLVRMAATKPNKSENKSDESIEDEEKNMNRVKIKGNTKEKQITDLRLTQKIENAHKGAIYCMEFSKKGDYLATGGQDSVLRIWTVCGSRADLKRDDDGEEELEEDTHSHTHEYNLNNVVSIVAYREFTGHRADIIDISWSNGEFILSASIDQTVMLWHTSRSRCLCLFQHSDIVTSVTFHPNEDYLFLSGSFDSRLRLWNILEHRVVDWVQVPTLVTCTTFSINGKFAIAGLYDGQCFFYSTQGHRLKYVTAIECRNASGKYRKGRKVTGLQYMPMQDMSDPQLLVTTNDSRLRLYTLSNFDMKCKYKGHENTQSQIHGRFSPDGQLIVCGSEDNNIYLWRVEKSVTDESNSIFQSKKTQKNSNRQGYYEYFKSNSKLPQCALFAPHRTVHYVIKFRTNYKEVYRCDEEKIRHIILTADTEGHINIYTSHSHEKGYKYPYNCHHSHRKSKGKKKKHK